MTVSLTSKMGAYVQDFTLDDVPEDALKIVRSAFADTVAVIMAGIEEDATRITFAQAAETDSGRGASVCLTDAVASSPMAALVGGTAAHALDYDDQSLSGHPSAVLVPAILAEGWRLNATGQEIAAAYLVGYEVWAELIGRNTGYHAKGWHPTSVFGTVGAAAAVAYLNKLRAEQVVCALAIAASKASGLASNFGTMTKPLHAGLAARNGLVSAQLAAGGMTASAGCLQFGGRLPVRRLSQYAGPGNGVAAGRQALYPESPPVHQTLPDLLFHAPLVRGDGRHPGRGRRCRG